MITKRILLVLMLLGLTYMFYPSGETDESSVDPKVEIKSNFDSFFAEHSTFKLLEDDYLNYIIYSEGVEIQLNLESKIKYTFDYKITDDTLNIVLNPVKFISKNNNKNSLRNMGSFIKNFHIHEKFKKINFKLEQKRDLYISAMYDNKLQEHNLLSTSVKFNNQAHIYTFNEITESCSKNKLPNLILKNKSIIYNSKIDSDSDYCDSSNKNYYFLTTKKYGYKDKRYKLDLNKNLLENEKIYISKTIKDSNLPIDFIFKNKINNGHHFKINKSATKKNYSLDYKIEDSKLILIVYEVPTNWITINHIFFDNNFLTKINDFKIKKIIYDQPKTNKLEENITTDYFDVNIFRHYLTFFSLISDFSCDYYDSNFYISVTNESQILNIAKKDNPECKTYPTKRLAINLKNYIINEYSTVDKWESFVDNEKVTSNIDELEFLYSHIKYGTLELYYNSDKKLYDSELLNEPFYEFNFKNSSNIEIINTNEKTKELNNFINRNIKIVNENNFSTKTKITYTKINEVSYVLMIDNAYPLDKNYELCKDFYNFKYNKYKGNFDIDYKDSDNCKAIEHISYMKLFKFVGDFDYSFMYKGNKQNQIYRNTSKLDLSKIKHKKLKDKNIDIEYDFYYIGGKYKLIIEPKTLNIKNNNYSTYSYDIEEKGDEIYLVVYEDNKHNTKKKIFDVKKYYSEIKIKNVD